MGCPVEYTTDPGSATGFQPMFDTDLNSGSIAVVLMSGGCEVTLTAGLAGNEAHIRDCMVSLAMAAAQVGGVEIFNGEISAAMDSCMEDFPDGFDADALYWYWPNAYGYAWAVIFKQDSVLLAVKRHNCAKGSLELPVWIFRLRLYTCRYFFTPLPSSRSPAACEGPVPASSAAAYAPASASWGNAASMRIASRRKSDRPARQAARPGPRFRRRV